MLDALAERPDAAAAYCGSQRVLPDGRMTCNSTDGSLASKPIETLLRSCFVAIHSVLVSRQIVTGHGGFDPQLRTCEDWDLWQRVARLRTHWVHVDEVLSYYRVSDASLSRNYARLLQDAEVVVRRGFRSGAGIHDRESVDETIAPDPDESAADQVVAEVALWFGSLASVVGESTEFAVEVLGRLPPPLPGDAPSMAETMLHAAAEALCLTPPDLARHWQAFGPALTQFIEDLGIAWSDRVVVRRLLFGPVAV